MNALLVKNNDNTQNNEPSLRMADTPITYSTNPHTVVRQLRADGLGWLAIGVYIAIADRQMSLGGEFFRSNQALAEELKVHRSTIVKAIRELIENDYISKWYVNGNRRMRVKVRGFHSTHPRVRETPPLNPIESTDKENNIKKTQQTPLSFSSAHIERFGLGFLEGLAAGHGSDRVMASLQAYEKADKTKIRNSKAWLTDACKKEYKPSNAQKPKRFPECTLEHENIIKAYQSQSKDNADEIFRLFSAIEQKHGYLDSGEVSKIAHKIWRSTNA